MEIKTNGDYNRCQLNETTNLSPDGKVLSKSLMLNLRGESTKEVWKLYRELKGLIDGREEEPARKIKKEKKATQREEKNCEKCPKCGGLLIRKTGISRSGRSYDFQGCANFPICSFSANSKPFLSETEKHAPCDEDLISAIPF